MRRAVKITSITAAVIFAAVFVILPVRAYDTNIAHPYLTETTIGLFNSQSGNRISNNDKQNIIQGTIDEDTPIRWMNHFFEPNEYSGLLGYSTAKDWAQDGPDQSGYLQGDQSWKTAIEAYSNGDNQNAFIALGHVLHLIEDMTVPAHTRLDIHVFNGGDPYEQWVKLNKQKITANVIVRAYDIDSPFYYLANYSNRNFKSNDTIDFNPLLSRNLYWKDIGDGQSLKCVKGVVEGKSFCLAKYEEDKMGNIAYNVTNYFVNADYFSLLAPKAVSYGAGVIQLFFEKGDKLKAETEAAKKAVFEGYLKIAGNIFAWNQAVLMNGPWLPGKPSSAPQTVAIKKVLGVKMVNPTTTPKTINPVKTYPPTTTTTVPTITVPTSTGQNIINPPLPTATTPSSTIPKKEIPATTTEIYNSSEILHPPGQTASFVAPSSSSTPPLPPPPAPILDTVFDYLLITSSTLTEIYGTCSTDTYGIAVYFAPDSASSTVPAPLSATTTVSSTLWQASVPLISGYNAFYFSALNSEGVSSSFSAPAEIVSDREPPAAGFSSISQATSTTSTVVNLTYSATDTYSLEPFFDLAYSADNLSWADWLVGSTSTVYSFSTTGTGDVFFRLRASDAVGNISEWAIASTTIAPLPYVYNYLDGTQTSTEAVLTKEGSPYILKIYTVPAGKTLKIEPGAVIKGLSKTSRMHISGVLSAIGASGDRIIFTSVQDRSFGDDRMNTPLLGVSAPPGPANWTGVWFQPGGNGNISHADFRYAGFDPYLCVAAIAVCGYYSRTIDVDTATLAIDDATISAGWLVGINSVYSSLTISNSTIDGSPNPVSEDWMTIGIYALKNSLNIRAVNFKNLYYGIKSSVQSRNWPAVTTTDFSIANFTNVTYPLDPAGFFPL